MGLVILFPLSFNQNNCRYFVYYNDGLEYSLFLELVYEVIITGWSSPPIDLVQNSDGHSLDDSDQITIRSMLSNPFDSILRKFL